LARRGKNGFTTRRVLSWSFAGGASIAFSGWWVWSHRDAFIHRPDWYDWTAVSMPWLWTFATIVMVFRDYWAYGKEGKPKSSTASDTGGSGSSPPRSM
jgi:hypothetical protein